MQCEHLVVLTTQTYFVIITALLPSGDYSSMKEQREDGTWRRKVVHETLLAVEYPRRPQFSSTSR
jgi:hypothetical protein